MAKKDLSKSAANVGAAAINATETTAQVETYAGTTEDDRREGRQMISAWVDRNVWADIRDLAQFRAAGGQRNHLGQPLSAGRLVEEALIDYLEKNREELDKFRAFFRQMRKK